MAVFVVQYVELHKFIDFYVLVFEIAASSCMLPQQCQNDQFRRMFECQAYKSNWCSLVVLLDDIDKIYYSNLDYYFRIFKFNEDLLANLNFYSAF